MQVNEYVRKKSTLISLQIREYHVYFVVVISLFWGSDHNISTIYDLVETWLKKMIV